MQGFDPKFRDIPDYILGITKEIWEDRGIATLRRYCAPAIPVRSPASVVVGNEGVIADEGDIFDIPTGIFRGFENVGTDYGIIMSILGGDDAGGGVIWAPQVIEDAQAHGLILSKTGRLYDTTCGERLPAGIEAMPPLSAAALQAYPETPVEDIVPRFIGRYQDMVALSARAPARVIGGREALILDRPGFEVDFIGRESLAREAIAAEVYQVLMIHRGHWRIAHTAEETVLAPGDICAIPAGVRHALAPSMTGDAALFRVRPTDDPAGPTRR